jgi:hypothetical protein
MARQLVAETGCDRCGRVWQMPLKKSDDPDTTLLPSGWLHIEISSASASVLSLDLCSDCKGPVLAAAGKGDLK